MLWLVLGITAAPQRFGLSTDGHDDQQFALNALHWLSRLLP
jgi:hypothetical protein